MTTSIMPDRTTAAARFSSGHLAPLARNLVMGRMAGIRNGRLAVIANGETLDFGSSEGPLPLTAILEVHDPRFWTATAFGGSIGAAESYMDGHWTSNDLTALFRIILRNPDAFQGLDRGTGRLTAPLHRLFHLLRRNTRRGSRRNIAAHYDLGNDFYRLFLDETMTYSAGIFPDAQSTLQAASLNKYDRIARKLGLTDKDHVIEIGGGWGGFAEYAATHFGCRVTTTTISDAQYRYAKQRIAAAGLSDRVQVLQKDYRDLNGRYDKLVSIEMIEAVGHQYLGDFFAACSGLLKPAGTMALQAITITDQVYDQHVHSVDFIKRYIFPGSTIPSTTAMLQAVTRRSDMRLFHLEEIGPHYARTLAAWRRNFMDRLEDVRRLGYPESFIRMWEFYLAYCEAGFAERYLGNVQMVLAKPLAREAPILPAIEIDAVQQ
ncbi:SAM-dependent methyltransferase [Desulfatitalea alkaliphila]|uniref:Cyclopropane-fatty-acyl-phospholipid synthase family protein n=1 Tax=Desulfatitalea alkaliphila TaxID=2929485 RepID=A0AA41R412_9BACT|nr:cyclopropane-fatty-acyl-phospholipid synthase family protein [Desulfatitalea alkaliphila]MCJ8502877.1 cyclopropane-fatty-acyl-phospholipid synthase family protein [Desulfatitalea alkaliphila]